LFLIKIFLYYSIQFHIKKKMGYKINKFISDFLHAMDNKSAGHSLRKWLSVGFFWLVVLLCLIYTDNDNLTIIIGILTGMISALIITYSVSNIQEKKIEHLDDEHAN
jgi:FtsH-binding integral membrane protein